MNRWDRTEPRITIQEDATDFNLNGHAQSDRDMYNRGSCLDGEEQFGLFDESDRQSDRVFLNRKDGRQSDADRAQVSITRGRMGEQSSFLNLMDREIESMDRRLQSIQDSNSQLLEKQNRIVNRKPDDLLTNEKPADKTERMPERETLDRLHSTRVDEQPQRESAGYGPYRFQQSAGINQCQRESDREAPVSRRENQHQQRSDDYDIERDRLQFTRIDGQSQSQTDTYEPVREWLHHRRINDQAQKGSYASETHRDRQQLRTLESKAEYDIYNANNNRQQCAMFQSESERSVTERRDMPSTKEGFEEGPQRYLKEKRERESHKLTRLDGIPGVHDFDRKSNYTSQKSEGHQAGYTVKEEETRSVGSDNKQEIDAEIARLMRLRRRLDESQNERDIESVEYDRQRSVTSETELKRNIDPPPALRRELPDTQHRSSELFQSEKTGCQGQFWITTNHRPAQDSHVRQIPRQIYMRNFEPSVGQPKIQTVAGRTMKDSAERPQYQERYRTVKKENVREEETDSMKKERLLFQARKDKELLLKAREDMLIEKENK